MVDVPVEVDVLVGVLVGLGDGVAAVGVNPLVLPFWSSTLIAYSTLDVVTVASKPLGCWNLTPPGAGTARTFRNSNTVVRGNVTLRNCMISVLLLII